LNVVRDIHMTGVAYGGNFMELTKVHWPEKPGWYVHPNYCEWFYGPYPEPFSVHEIIALDPCFLFKGLCFGYIADPKKIKTMMDFWDCCS